MPASPRFSPGLSQEELTAGYRKVGSAAPFKKADVQKAYEPYGLKLDPSRKNATDSQLRKTAAQAVVKWHTNEKAKTAAKKSSPSTPSTQSSGTQSTASTASPAARSTAPSPKPQLLDDNYLTGLMKKLGITGIPAGTVPPKFRSSPQAAEQFLRDLAARRAAARRTGTGGAIPI